MNRHALALGGMLVVLTGCSVGRGEGEVKSDQLLAHDCWDSEYDMNPDFFAAVPYRSTLQIRVQRGSDLQEVSDGLAVLVDDIDVIRSKWLNTPLPASLPPGVAPPGSVVSPPEPAEGDPPFVHAALYLQRSCHNQNAVLYAVSGTFTFAALFNGDPNEKEAAAKFTDAWFDVMVGDPRDVPLGQPANAIPEELQSRVVGSFKFYFERGQPGQPFP